VSVFIVVVAAPAVAAAALPSTIARKRATMRPSATCAGEPGTLARPYAHESDDDCQPRTRTHTHTPIHVRTSSVARAKRGSSGMPPSNSMPVAADSACNHAPVITRARVSTRTHTRRVPWHHRYWARRSPARRCNADKRSRPCSRRCPARERSFCGRN
jgi:hypothetical protein